MDGMWNRATTHVRIKVTIQPLSTNPKSQLSSCSGSFPGQDCQCLDLIPVPSSAHSCNLELPKLDQNKVFGNTVRDPVIPPRLYGNCLNV
jgi:hypothetical protein